MKDLVVYLSQMVDIVIGKTWPSWELGSGLVGLFIWLAPKGIEKWLETSRFISLWSAYGGWVALTLFVFISVFLAPFLAWREVYSQLQSLNSADAKRKREKDELELEELKVRKASRENPTLL